MSRLGDIIVSLNSCSHDIAAAFLAMGLAVVRMLSIKYPASGYAASGDAFLRVYKVAGRITSYAFCVIIVTVAVMAVYLKRGGDPLGFGYLRVVAVAVKYGVMLILAVIGLLTWSGLSKKVDRLRSKHNL